MKIRVISFYVLFYCIYHQIDKFEYLKKEIEIKTNDTLSYYRKLLRNCLVETYLNYFSEKIGGEGKVIQMDETAVVKRKYRRGKKLAKEIQWIIGDYDLVTKDAFMTLKRLG